MDRACLASVPSWDVISILILHWRTALASSLSQVLSLHPIVKKFRQLNNVSVPGYHKISEMTEREACIQKAPEESSQPRNEAAGGTSQGRGPRLCALLLPRLRKAGLTETLYGLFRSEMVAMRMDFPRPSPPQYPRSMLANILEENRTQSTSNS